MPSARASGRSALVRALVLLVVSVVCIVSARKAILAGDGVEYFSMLESFWNHGTPDQRPGDVVTLTSLLSQHGYGLGPAHDGFFVTSAGRWYSYHFWLYPLLALPAKGILHLLGASELYALSMTNAALLVATVAWALRGRATPTPPRVALIALATVGPVLWYVQWPHGEVLTWACVVSSLVSLDEKRYARGAALAAIGALHAPPVVFLAGLCVVMAAVDREPGRLRRTAHAVAGAAIMAFSPLFYLLEFGVSNLIVATGSADPHLISARRVLALAFDLDQGMLPFVPAALLLGLAGLACAIVARRWLAVGVALTALAMMAVSSQTTNFNAGCSGMNRYAVWTMPLFAWLAAHGLPWESAVRRWRIAAPGAIAGVAALQLLLANHGGARDDAHEHHPLATFVLTHAPSLYMTDPEIFAERTAERSLDVAWHGLPGPIGFVGPHGGVTKLLVDGETFDSLPERFDVDARWFGETRTRVGERRGLFFLDPPRGAVRAIGSEGRIEFADGWYEAEALGADRWRWMGKRASIVVRAASSAAAVVRLAGWVPEALGDKAGELTVSINGSIVDRFVAPRQRFTRDYPLDAPRLNAHVTIEASDVTRPAGDTRDLGFALLRAELAGARQRLGDPYVRFVGPAWSEPFGEGEAQSRCMTARTELQIDPIPGAQRAALVLGLWVPSDQLSRPAKLRVTMDGAVIDAGPVHNRTRRRIPLRADVAHRLVVEPDVAVDTPLGHVAACVDVLRYTRD